MSDVMSLIQQRVGMVIIS